jgi:2-C-methyl-D-erythritol 2,4-cyclodiphosphate synthase
MRIGQSTDIHPLVSGRKLILGGVEIPYEKGLLGHSDADVLLHAVIEALIGAMGLGDIGRHFPDDDPAYEGISSLVLLEKTRTMMDREGYQVGNIDALILLQQPKLKDHIPQMEANIAAALGCDVSRVNVKATTGEHLGFIGEGRGAAAQAVVLIEEKEEC